MSHVERILFWTSFHGVPSPPTVSHSCPPGRTVPTKALGFSKSSAVVTVAAKIPSLKTSIVQVSLPESAIYMPSLIEWWLPPTDNTIQPPASRIGDLLELTDMLNYGFQTKTQCPYKFYLHIRYPEDRVIPVPVPAKTQQLLRQVAIDLHVTIYVFSNRSLSSIYYSDESCASIGLLHIQDSYDQVGEYTPLIAARKPPVNLQKERRVHPVQDPKAEYQTVHVRDPGQERPLLNVSIK
ncbi:MAG: hypothetical protein JOS17DRAFT_823218 [Linnemannia elongata]|nr:MAG: hypothetical protein JOS17DRAFT_823218 [Linnemannia elongata]